MFPWPGLYLLLVFLSSFYNAVVTALWPSFNEILVIQWALKFASEEMSNCSNNTRQKLSKNSNWSEIAVETMSLSTRSSGATSVDCLVTASQVHLFYKAIISVSIAASPPSLSSSWAGLSCSFPLHVFSHFLWLLSATLNSTPFFPYRFHQGWAGLPLVHRTFSTNTPIVLWSVSEQHSIPPIRLLSTPLSTIVYSFKQWES